MLSNGTEANISKILFDFGTKYVILRELDSILLRNHKSICLMNSQLELYLSLYMILLILFKLLTFY